jgi:RHS repeat-associated protein
MSEARRRRSFPCLSSRRNRRLRATSAFSERCSGPDKRRFRKARICRQSPQPTRNRRLGKKLQTCFEGPFGEVIRATGPMVKANPFRFSTKYQDDESDLLYYGYRYYGASIGRWIGRDPTGEQQGPNLQAFDSNDSINIVDTDGRFAWLAAGALGLAAADAYFWYQALKRLPNPNPPAEMIPRSDGAQNFIVHKCAEVIVLGHASLRRPHRFFFDKGFESCSGAGVTGCGSKASNAKIPANALIPGTPNHTDEVSTSDPEYQDGIKNIRNGALQKAGAICRDPKQCCKKVLIYYFDAPKNETYEDALYQDKTPMVETYDCKSDSIVETRNNRFPKDRVKRP